MAPMALGRHTGHTIPSSQQHRSGATLSPGIAGGCGQTGGPASPHLHTNSPIPSAFAPLQNGGAPPLSTVLGPLYPPRRCSTLLSLVRVPRPAPEAPSARAQRSVPLLPLSAAASGPPFLGNNGAENGRLKGEAGRRCGCLGTDGARRAGTEPAEDRREQRSES